MDKKTLFVAGGIILVIVSAVIYVVSRPESAPIAEESVPVQEEPQNTTEPPAPVVAKGAYLDYSEEAVAAMPGTKLLFFHAPWCPQCRELEADIKSRELPENVTIFKVDYDSSQTLRQKYDVTLQTTFVKIDDSGNKIASYVAYDEPQFSSVQRELLP